MGQASNYFENPMELVVELDIGQGDDSLELSFGVGQTPVGLATIAWSELGVRWLSFGDARPDDAPQTRWPCARLKQNDGHARTLLRDAFHGELSVPVVLQGTEFQRLVWRALLQIEFGQTISYGALAQRLGKPGASRAVGSAVGANDIAYLVPCHRVLRSNGKVGQFRWGTDVKVALLEWESQFRHGHVL